MTVEIFKKTKEIIEIELPIYKKEYSSFYKIAALNKCYEANTRSGEIKLWQSVNINIESHLSLPIESTESEFLTACNLAKNVFNQVYNDAINAKNID